MKTLIAEKPSVARDIARIIGATQKNEGYLSGNGWQVTWAFGHLVEIWCSKGEERWDLANLPIIPEQFLLRGIQKNKKEDPSIKRQLSIIKRLFDNCDEIIVATDAGREGELIFRYIYTYLGCRTPFRRLWISSLTDRSIREGLRNLRPGKEFDSLYMSAKARSEADWLVGINATQALTLSANRLLSLGRVQTPTLAMICSRYNEYMSFVPEPYWTLICHTEKGGNAFHMTSTRRYTTPEEAESNRKKTEKARTLKVTKADTERKETQPPLLYDLTTLQREANSRYGLTASQTLNTAQALYENKAITYPRTSSRFITWDIYNIMPTLIKSLEGHPSLSSFATSLSGERLNTRSVNPDRVSDHHALLITGEQKKDMTDTERIIYDMIATRMLESFSAPCIKDVTVVEAEADNVTYKATGSITIKPGWRAIRNEKDKDQDGQDLQTLPSINTDDILPVTKAEKKRDETKPKPIHTEASLLASMETAGKDSDDENIRESMKNCGLGTPATRASIIETLLKREYIYRHKKKLLPTELGMTIFHLTEHTPLSNVEMTGQWEYMLNRIAEKKENPDRFKEGIEEFTRLITKELSSNDIQSDVRKAEESDMIRCPKCSSEVKIWPKYAKCTNKDCDFYLWTTICQKKLTKGQIRDLLEKKVTSKITGFISKAGTKFSARLTMDDTGKTNFKF